MILIIIIILKIHNFFVTITIIKKIKLLLKNHY